MMSHKFTVIDVSLGIPPVLLPLFGFSEVTAPELSLEHQEIIEGNFEYPRKVFKKATVNNIVMSRGASLQDTDFWIWASNYLEGQREKKNLLLIQSMQLSPDAVQTEPAQFGVQLPTAINFANDTPGRAWVLRNCSPVRYKTASDFSSRTTEVSIHELEIAYEFFIEFNMGTNV